MLLFKKNQIPWNKGKEKPMPTCSICNIKLRDRRSKACRNHKDVSSLTGKKQTKSFIKKRAQQIKKAWEEGKFKKRKYIQTISWRKKVSQSHKRKVLAGLWHSWKGGITPENHRIRTSLEYKLWRKSCFERDNFTCQKYNTKGGDLVVHHINNFAEYPELRFAIDNGITLSKKAHKEFHKKYGMKNNTKEQLQEFLLNML